MGFVETQFPTDISYRSSGGPEYATDIVIAGSGYEQRNHPFVIALASAPGLTQDTGMQLLLTIIQGLSAGLRVQESPLYRYPYRYAEEAFRGDAKRIAGDIAANQEAQR